MKIFFYKNRKVNKIFFLGNMQLSDEEIENAVSSGNLSEVTKGVMLALNEKKALYDEVKSRADELKNLERQMGELAQMFHDLHIMVVSQASIYFIFFRKKPHKKRSREKE